MNTSVHSTETGADILETIKSAEEKAKHDIESCAKDNLHKLEQYREEKEAELMRYEETLKVEGMEKLKRQKEKLDADLQRSLKEIDGEGAKMLETARKAVPKLAHDVVGHVTNYIK